MGLVFSYICYGFYQVRVLCSCLATQLKQLFTQTDSFWAWVDQQIEVFNLLRIDRNHRLDVFWRGDRKDLSGGSLPHVDTMSMSMDDSMMDGDVPTIKKLVLVGGGHSHAFTLKKFGMSPLPGVELILITRDTLTPYSGMMPGYVAGEYSKRECHIDLVRLARFADAKFIHAEAIGIDHKRKLVLLKDRPPISYDVCSINIGICPKLICKEEMVQELNLVPVKPISEFADKWAVLLNSLLTSKKECKVVIVGAGAAGTELACSMEARYRKECKKLGKQSRNVKFVLVSRRSYILPSHNKSVREIFMRILKDRGIEVCLGAEVSQITDGNLISTAGEKIEYTHCIWCTQATAQSWLEESGLQCQGSFVAVKDSLESVNCPGIFAAGDCAAVLNHPRPKAGVFAVRHGPPLTRNLRAKLLNKPLEDFYPQKKFLGLIGTGETNNCVASKGLMALEGEWLWDLKDWIDRKWMAQYSTMLTLKAMPESKAPMIATVSGEDAISMLAAKPMRCGGCGGKVGASTLSQTLKRLRDDGLLTKDNEHVLIGLDQPDDAAILKASKYDSVHTIDYLKKMVDDHYTFGQITACHCLSDLDAMCCESVAAMAVVMVPYGMAEHMGDTLYQLLAGACNIFKHYGVSLIGGHTCEGDELALGFSVHGLMKGEQKQKGGIKAGQVLILTKAVGTGTIMAAEMRLKAFGEWVQGAVDSMKQPNLEAGQCFARFGATACTDVTGFGVAGHLLEMCKASKVEVDFYINSLPILAGAQECVNEKIFSSLQPENVRLRRGVKTVNDNEQHEAFPLLFDPQTSGGLLASVPADKANECLKELRKLGYERACVVGKVVGAREELPYITICEDEKWEQVFETE